MAVFIGISAESYEEGQLQWSKAGHDYMKSLVAVGAVPVIIPFVNDIALAKDYAIMCDGLILPGGNDVDPSFYASQKKMHCGETDKEFDRWQMALLENFLVFSRRVLGINRGMQLINVYFGGSLYQDIVKEYKKARAKHMNNGLKEEMSHAVETVPGSSLWNVLGDRFLVNSFHHQAIKRPGSELCVTAMSTDGLIEGIVSNDGLASGVQWNPESFLRLSSNPMIALFQDFVDHCK